MILTVTIPETAAPQSVPLASGAVLVAPGESVTGEFGEDAVDYMRACPGHYMVSEEAAKPRRGRPPLNKGA